MLMFLGVNPKVFVSICTCILGTIVPDLFYKVLAEYLWIPNAVVGLRCYYFSRLVTAKAQPPQYLHLLTTFVYLVGLQRVWCQFSHKGR